MHLHSLFMASLFGISFLGSLDNIYKLVVFVFTLLREKLMPKTGCHRSVYLQLLLKDSKILLTVTVRSNRWKALLTFTVNSNNSATRDLISLLRGWPILRRIPIPICARP
jgi:hypothetical protein